MRSARTRSIRFILATFIGSLVVIVAPVTLPVRGQPVSSVLSVSTAHAATVNTTLMMPGNSLGMVGHWSFDGKDILRNISDTSGQSNNGFLKNSSTTTRPGAIGQALQFSNPQSTYVDITNQSPFNFNYNSTFTLSAWVLRNTAANDDRIFARQLNSGSLYTGYTLDIDSSGGIQGCGGASVNFTLANDIGGNKYIQVCSTNKNLITLGAWHLVTLTYDGTNVAAGVRLYVDGALQSNNVIADTLGTNATTNNVDLRLGADTIGGASSLAMDDARVYNRVLSASEVLDLYALGASTKQSATVNPPNLNSGLVAHYTFDGKDMIRNVTDTSGSGLNGIFFSGSTTTVPGTVGQALYFNASHPDDVENSTGLFFDAGSFSYSVWVKTTQKPASLQARILGTPSISDTNGYAWLNNDTGGGIFTVELNTQTPADYQQITSNVVISDGKWHNLALVVDRSTNLASVYVDGVFKNSLNHAFTGNFGISSDHLTIRIGNQNGGYAYSGAIDDARIYNRALSAAEIQQLYKLGSATKQGITTNPPNLDNGLVGHWTFDGKDMLRNVADTSGNGNTAYLRSGFSTTTVPGAIGQAFRFPGVSGTTKAITIPSQSGATVSTTRTFAVWIKPEPYATALAGQFIEDILSNGGGSYLYRLRINTGDATERAIDLYRLAPFLDDPAAYRHLEPCGCRQ
jgi:hypothetical protein